MPITVDIPQGVAEVLQSIHEGRLAAILGAGLSMDKPSRLPSAYELAVRARQSYEALIGPAPFADDLGQQVEYFFGRGELATFYLRKLIDQHAFAGMHNAGHECVADLILVRALDVAVTTNIDCLIEHAGLRLYGQIESCIDAPQVAALPADVTPLLKIHGCRAKDFDNTVWTPSQLKVSPVEERVNGVVSSIANRLLNRDLLIVGFATDWDYLNQVLERAIGAVNPARVIIVNPSDTDTLEQKAPGLFAIGNKPGVARFLHVQSYGGAFLEELRRAFSKAFVRQVLRSGASTYRNLRGVDPSATDLEPPDMDNESLWLLRRDLEGCKPLNPCLRRNPVTSTRLGLTLLKLRTAGATVEGNRWKHGGRSLRVIFSEPSFLNEVKAQYAGEEAPIAACDIAIVVGAEDVALATDVARPEEVATITRGSATRWLTASDAEMELGI